MSTGAAVRAVTAPRHGDAGDRQPGGSWFLDFLRRELAPFPGRLSLVVRMVLAATLTMLLIMTFHLPAGALGGYFALNVSRESLRNTAQQTWLTIAFFGLGTVYTMVGIALFVDSPLTHFFWVIGSFYLIFFVMGTARNYGLAAGFSFLIATAIPIWDRAGEVNLKVSLTLYTLLSVIIGTLCTLFVELVYRSFHPRDPVISGVADRLSVAAAMLLAAADGHPPAKAHEARLLQYAMVGPSSLRRQIIRAGVTAEMRARVAAVVSMTGRLVELCAATLDDIEHGARPTADESDRLRALGTAVTVQASEVNALTDIEQVGRSKLSIWQGTEQPSHFLPILPEIERSVRLLSEIFDSFGLPIVEATPDDARSGVEKARKRASDIGELLGSRPSLVFVADAFTNRDHLVFALRGCLAATLCYLVYNGIDWPGINTSVATCIITALGTIGSSRQKQLLRISGAIFGGFVISLPAQVFLLPLMDSITAFTFFFAIVSGIAAWFATSSPRLSYFGLQVALAFYLVNLQEPFEQISLAVARDRVVGVLLGLVAMWLVFDQFAAPKATVRMGELLESNLVKIGDLAVAVADVRLAAAKNTDPEPALARMRHLRDRINDGFSQMNAQADAVQFEFGRSRLRKLQERERMQAMQPPMRSLFLLEIALLESDNLPREARRILDPHADASLQGFLHELSTALHRIAALGATAPAAGAPVRRADVAVDNVRATLRKVRSKSGSGRESPLTLCDSMASALNALERAATASPVAE